MIWKEIDRWRDAAGVVHTARMEVEEAQKAADGNTRFWTCAGIAMSGGGPTADPITCLICLGEAPPVESELTTNRRCLG